MCIGQKSVVNSETLNQFLGRLKMALSHIQGVLIEDKDISLSIHFRMVSMGDLAEFFDIISKISKEYKDIFEVNTGKKVLEIRPVLAWNKGDAVTWITNEMGKGRMPIYIGDDTTDEDAFRAIKGKGISICVGGSPEAEYFLKRQEEVRGLLELLSEWINE